MDLKDNELGFLLWQLDYILKQIEAADNKMQFISVVFLGLATVLFTKGSFAHLGLQNPCSLSAIILLFAKILFVLSLVMFFFFYWKVIFPRTDPGEEDYRSVIFWKHVSEMCAADFRKLSLEKRLEDLPHQIVITAKVAREKFKYVQFAYNLLMFYVLFFVLILLLGKGG